MLDGIGQTDLEVIRDEALNERNYGDLAGLNKDDARARNGARSRFTSGAAPTTCRRPATTARA
jgi:bisphosphoglycerate-dependent phosphoglycerate mutase